MAERVLFAEPAHVAVLRRMHLISAQSVAIAALAPFVPIWLTAVPLDKLLKTIVGALL
ncbi:MAG TPA: hypothetical protein VLK83_04800 [Rhodanobacteraceae bacterium]|nr:hypothetical protein [Rhodanobacteraceae bacterium]